MFSDYGGHVFPFIFLLYKINEDEKLGLIKSWSTCQNHLYLKYSNSFTQQPTFRTSAHSLSSCPEQGTGLLNFPDAQEQDTITDLNWLNFFELQRDPCSLLSFRYIWITEEKVKSRRFVNLNPLTWKYQDTKLAGSFHWTKHQIGLHPSASFAQNSPL